MNRARYGFTLIELTAATTIAALLMVAVLHVIGTLAARRRSLAEAPGSQTWRRQLEDQLRWDCQNSRSILLQDRRLVLTGFASRDSETGSPTFLPTEVRYELQTRGKRSWLTRHEVPLDGRGPATGRFDFVCCDVFQMRVDRPGPTESRLAFDTESPIPHQLRVMLMRGDEEPPIEVMIEL